MKKGINIFSFLKFGVSYNFKLGENLNKITHLHPELIFNFYHDNIKSYYLNAYELIFQNDILLTISIGPMEISKTYLNNNNNLNYTLRKNTNLNSLVGALNNLNISWCFNFDNNDSKSLIIKTEGNVNILFDYSEISPSIQKIILA